MDLWTACDDSLENMVFIVIMAMIEQYYQTYYLKEPYNTQLVTGDAYVGELLRSNPRRITTVLRMPVHTYFSLVNWLVENTSLKSTRVSSLEKVAIFIGIAGHGESYRQVTERFGHSMETISRIFHEVLNALVVLHRHIVRQSTAADPISRRVSENYRWAPYFQDCLGALDGTHVAAHVSDEMAAPFRNRKGALSQNVLGVCRFNMQFSYVWPGWEGSAHDSKVLQDARSRGNFVVPAGKYYLADAGYSNSKDLLTPYRGVRYHLKENRQAGKEPESMEELFNLRHSSLRMEIERIFGVLKRRFKIIQTPPEYPIRTQVLLVLAVTALHNFIAEYSDASALEDGLDDLSELATLEDQDVNNDDERTQASGASDNVMDTLRDDIASRMWAEYQHSHARRNQLS